MNQRLVPVLLITSLLSGIWLETAFAQVPNNIVPDATLGTEASIVTPEIPTTTRITGGAARGSNLFHSFQEFSVGTNQAAWFDNATTVRNILVRVTGRNLSNIDGTLRANGVVDLFVLNPNGIVLGPNAKLAIGGTFSALTTNAIPLGPEGLFRADVPEQSQLLDIKPSAAFSLAQLQPQGNIQVNANLDVKGQGITLVGKTIDMTGSLTNVAPATASTLTLRSLNDINLTNLQVNNPDGKELYVPNQLPLSPVRLVLESGNNITLQNSDIGLYGGLFQATAPGKITLGSSRLFSQSFVNNPAEPITFQAGTVEFKGKAPLKPFKGNFEDTSGGREDASAITIATDRSIRGANGPIAPVNITITSTNPINIENTRLNQPRFKADGTGEPKFIPASADEKGLNEQRSDLYPINIVLDTKQNVTLKNTAIGPRGGGFSVNTDGDFNFLGITRIYNENYTNQASGFISIQARDINMVGREGISTNALAGGRAGDVRLTAANNLTLKDTGVGSNTVNRGDAGNVILTAGNLISANVAGVGNQSGFNFKNFDGNRQVTGNNGRVEFHAKTIDVGSFGVNIDHYGLGGGGLILLDATEDIKIGGGGYTTNGKGIAKSADIIINAGRDLKLTRGSAISTSVESKSTGGNITVTAQRSVAMVSSISTTTRGEGKAGDISITSPSIDLQVDERDPKNTTRGSISSYTGTPKENSKIKATGDAGNITLTAPGGQILLRSSSGIANTSFADSQGNAGRILLRSASLDIQRGSQILGVTNGSGNIGLIDIDMTKIIRMIGTSDDGKLPSSILSAVGEKGDKATGQEIRIKSPVLEIYNGAAIISSSLGNGDSNNITINSGDITLDGNSLAARKPSNLTSGILTSVGITSLPSDKDGALITEKFTTQLSPTTGVVGVTFLPLKGPGKSSATAKGNSGNINITTGNLDLINGAQLITAILGDGKAGDIKIVASGNIRLVNQAGIRADSESGKRGNITLNNPEGILFLRGDSRISAVSRRVGKDGEDGNITINTGFLVSAPTAITSNDILKGNDIFAISQDNLLKGDRSLGNNIKLTAQGVIGFKYQTQPTPGDDILATGSVTLNLPDIDPSRGLTVLPAGPIDVSQKIDRTCNAATASSGSSFVTKGDGGLPATPTSPNVPNGLIRLATVEGDRPASSQPQTTQAKMPVEAQTSTRLANGKIRFQADAQATVAQAPRSTCLAPNH
jgi:filamentous hemagglutinin family protein